MIEDKQIHILLIEDEPEVRMSYEDMFSFLGHSVSSAENGQLGLQKIQQKQYDIVITDLNMPVMDGLETLRRIKKYDKNIEVIVITGFATIENAIKAMKQGAFDYITKPVSIDHVKIILNKCVQKIRDKRENEQLKDLNRELKTLNELKDKFISITNHEIRTPLSVIKGYLELLDMELDARDGEEIEEYINIINNTLDETLETIESMSELSNFGQNSFKDNTTLLNVNEFLNEIFQENRLLFSKREIELNLEMDHEPLYVSVSPKRMRQAIRELLQNALKFTPEGGKVTVSCKNIDLKDKIFISIEDTGIGIPSDKLELIFEPFYEVQNIMNHSSSKTAFMGGGMGVGLSLAKEIIESSGGEIHVESEEKKGSVFTIVLTKVSESELAEKSVNHKSESRT